MSSICVRHGKTSAWVGACRIIKNIKPAADISVKAIPSRCQKPSFTYMCMCMLYPSSPLFAIADSSFLWVWFEREGLLDGKQLCASEIIYGLKNYISHAEA